MILEALSRLAETEGLLPDPLYENKRISWIIRVGDTGALLGIEDCRIQIGKRREGKVFRVPRPPQRTVALKSGFLVDNPKYALGLVTQDQKNKFKKPTDEAKAHDHAKKAAQLFLQLVQECAEETHDAGVQAVAAFLESPRLQSFSSFLEEVESNHLISFVYMTDANVPVHERPAVRAFWKTRQSGARVGGALRCVVTGLPIPSSELVPLLKKVPGGTPSGVALISFNKPAFESHGWNQKSNVAISADAALAVSTALNRLLDPKFPDPRPGHEGEVLPSRCIDVGGGTVLCFWAPEEPASQLVNDLSLILNPDDPDRVQDLYRSIWHGQPPSVRGVSRFYALTLSGTQGRAIVRSWFESTLQDLADHLAAYFDDIKIVRNTRPPRGEVLPPQIPLQVLLESLAVRGERSAIPPNLAAEFVAAILSGSRYPAAAMQKAIERARAEVGCTEWADLNRKDARAALIKAVLRRNTEHKEITPAMDPTNTQPGYLLGRLIAVLERFQQEALGDVNASVIDRFFAAASATPQAVFPRLLKNARHHSRKLADSSEGKANWLEKEMDEIIGGLGLEERKLGVAYTGLPSYLPLEQQALFVIGYHHQRHWLWSSKTERDRIRLGAMAIDGGNN